MLHSDERRYDAVLLAASKELTVEKAADRHLNGALAAGAYRVGVRLTEDEAQRLLPIFRVLVKKKVPC